MASTLLLLTIAIPWAGAIIVWFIGDEFTKLLHGVAVAFSVAAGVAALLLIPYATGAPVISVDAGPVFGVFTFAPDGLGCIPGCRGHGDWQPGGDFLRGLHER